MTHSILTRYPKIRPDLPAEYRAIYEEHYFANRNGQYKTTALSQRLESWMHRQVAADLAGAGHVATLEIGAGTLNQLPYEPVSGVYDIVEPFRALYQKAAGRERIRNIFDDISEARVHGPYNRITSVAVFEHIADLPVAVAHAALLLAPKGTLRVAIPNEGTLLWKLGTQVTGQEFKRKYKLCYEVLMRHEHVNTAAEIEQVLRVFFGALRCKVFGLCKSIALYRFYECSEPKINIAEHFLQNRG